MKSIIVKEGVENIDIEEWSHFVNNHPKGSIFQSYDIYISYTKVRGHCPYVFSAYHNNRLVGVLLADVIKEGRGLKSFCSRRSIIMSGPIVDDDDSDIIDHLLKAYDKFVANKVIYTQIRNQFQQLANCDIFRQNGFLYEPHLNYLIHLDDEQSIWNRIGKGRIKQIKKAQNNGLIVDVYRDSQITDELIEEGYKVIQEVYVRAKLPLVDVELIKSMRNYERLVVFVVRTNDCKIAGCRFALSFRDCLYGWYAGSYGIFYKLFPNDLLIWETLRWACVNGYRIFDYGGAGSPNKPYGVRLFKSQMGGELVEYGRYEKVHKPLLMKFAKLGFSILRNISSKRN